MAGFFGLPRNVETLDSRIRMVVGFGLAVGMLAGELQLNDPVWIALGAYIFLTGALRYDPIYSALGIKKVKAKGEDL